MRLGEQLDPALQAATLALSRQAQHHASRFASIELRSRSTSRHLAPLGYLVSGLSGLALVVALWLL